MADEITNTENNAENQEEVQRQEINPVFEIDALVKDTYNLIATWHNDDGSSAGLKQLSLDLVHKITEAALQHVGLKATLNVDTEGVKG